MNGYPIRFVPIYQERVWGGRRLESVYGRVLPGTVPIGESWEISDRDEASSVVANGPWTGLSLSELVARHASALMGDAPLRRGRFPLLVKILDAREILSLQVHPPADRAEGLGGEPKSEMWFFTGADPGSEILAGLRPGTTRESFQRELSAGTVERCCHRIPVVPGDAMMLPSGRVHAIGAGLLLFEIQENSDTTFRVFDWNRVGLDGKPRPLHVRESLASIDFEDHAPRLVETAWSVPAADTADTATTGFSSRLLAAQESFRVEAHRGPSGARWIRKLARCLIVGVVRGSLRVGDGPDAVRLGAGDFCLVPASMGCVTATLECEAEWLTAVPGPFPERDGGAPAG
ncbi:MAG: type I phosphomannose isomerase catalytic subunit [Limisphaerales bacterium]